MATNFFDSGSRAAFWVGDWEVQPSSCRLVRNGTEHKLSPRSMDVLVYLAKRAALTVTHDEILNVCWPGSISTANAIQKCVVELRHAFGNGGGEPMYIETVPKRGYRLVAAVSTVAPAARAHGSGSPAAGIRESPPAIGPIQNRALANGAVPKSLAVVHFRSVDGTDENQLFAESIAADLVEGLSRNPRLKIVDRNLAFQYSLESTSVSAIANALDVQFVIDGAVVAVHDGLRISVSLLEIEPSRIRYAYTLDVQRGHVQHARNEAVTSVLAGLQVELDDAHRSAMQDWGTKNVNAYLAASDAAALRHVHGPRALRLAESRFRDAIRYDRGFANALSGLAHVLDDLSELSFDCDALDKWRGEVIAIRKTLREIDPSNEHAYWVDCVVETISSRSIEGLEATLRLAIQRYNSMQTSGALTNAGFTRDISWPPGIFQSYSELLLRTRLFREAIAYHSLVERIDPLNPYLIMGSQACAALTTGARNSVPHYEACLRAFPNYVKCLVGYVEALAAVGDHDGACDQLARLRAVEDDGPWTFMAESSLLALRGELKRNSPTFGRRLADPRCNAFVAGQIHLMAGDVGAGVCAWESMDRRINSIVMSRVVRIERLLPRSVVEDERYQDCLDGLGIGRRCTDLMRQRVAELAPITGVALTDSRPQRVVSWLPGERDE